MPVRPCLDCRALSTGTRCIECARRRKKIRNADRPIARAVIAASPVCAGCGTTEDLTADHVVSLSSGGTNEGRRRVLCRSCNSKKGG